MKFHFKIRRVLQTLSAILLMLLGVVNSSNAQVNNGDMPPAVRAELDRRGISETELRNRLLQRGIDMQELTQEQLIVLRPEIEQVIETLENEKKASFSTQGQAPSSTRQTVTNNGNLFGEGNANNFLLDSVPNGRGSANQLKTPPANVNTPQVQIPTGGINRSSALPPIYGHEIFANGAVSIFQTVDNAQIPDSYIIGEGDEIAINIFGASQVDFLFEVDRQGFIKPLGIDKILLRGLSLAQARELVRRRMSQYFVFGPGQFTLNVNGVRTLRVNVFGEVMQSGTYTLSAINGALNALVAAGGPTEQGSVRRIQRNRGNQSVIIDVYDYLNDPVAVVDNLDLQSSDIIFVPIARKVVTLQGAVRRPMRYELLDKEGLGDLIEYAGGFSATAFGKLVQIQRLVEGRQVVIDVDGEAVSTAAKIRLEDGDIVRVRQLEQPQRYVVAVQGAVELPGEFAFRDGLTLGDVVAQARLRRDARTDVAFIRRLEEDSTSRIIPIVLDEALAGGGASIRLQQGDEIRILSLNTFRTDAHIAVTGAVRAPIDRLAYPVDQQLTIGEALVLAGGKLPNAADKAILFRRALGNKNLTRYEMIDLDEAGSEIAMKAFDSLIVFPRELFTDAFMVSLRGAVRRPAEYVYNSGMSIRELITLAGGLSFGAASNRIDIFRMDVDGADGSETRIGTIEIDSSYSVTGGDLSFADLQPYDIIVVRKIANFQLISTVELQGEVVFPGSYPIVRDQQRISDFLGASGGVTSQAFLGGATLFRSLEDIGFVVVDMEAIKRNPAGPANIHLRDGDVLTIPSFKDLVTIRTEATRANEFYSDSLLTTGNVVVAFRGAMSAKKYVQNYAGGFQDRADKKSLTVRYPNGALKQTASFLGLRHYPDVNRGSTISVKMKPPKREKREREPRDWIGIATAITTAMMAGLTVVVIVLNRR